MRCWPLALALLLAGPVSGAEFSPAQYGAIADGVTLDTAALQRVINAAHTAGGGTVTLSAGTYLTGTLELRSGVTLHLAKGATLLGSPHIADYRRGKWTALLLAHGAENIAITGEGTIDGQGKLIAADSVRIFESGNFVEFFPGVAPGQTVNLGADTKTARIIDPHAMQRAGTLAAVVAPRSRADLATWRVDESVRPQLLEFSACRGVRVTGVTLKNAANWVEAYRLCEDLEISGIRVESTAYWNNDGLDIVNCRRVRITDCDINAGDDAICLKSEPDAGERGCEDILIARCRLRSSASAVKFGTASHHGFRRIRIEDIDVRDTYRSAIALESVDGAVLEDITVTRVRAKRTGNAFLLRLGHRNPAKPPGVLRRVELSDFEIEVPADRPDAGYEHAGPLLRSPVNLLPAVIAGLPDRPIEDVVLRNITITYGGGASRERAEVPFTAPERVPENRAGYPEFSMFGELPAWGLYVRHATGLRVNNFTLRLAAPDFRPAILLDRTTHTTFSGLQIGAGGGEPVFVQAGLDDVAFEKVMWPADAKETVRRLPEPTAAP